MVAAQRVAGDTALRPFKIDVPQADLEDLAALEQPQALSEDVRATFRSLGER